jgi:hypothetical protein
MMCLKLPDGGVCGRRGLVVFSVLVAGRLSSGGPKTGGCAWLGVS